MHLHLPHLHRLVTTCENVVEAEAEAKARNMAAGEIVQGIHHQEDAAAHAPVPNVPSCEGKKYANVKL
jgi:hypothetical protein